MHAPRGCCCRSVVGCRSRRPAARGIGPRSSAGGPGRGGALARARDHGRPARPGRRRRASTAAARPRAGAGRPRYCSCTPSWPHCWSVECRSPPAAGWRLAVVVGLLGVANVLTYPLPADDWRSLLAVALDVAGAALLAVTCRRSWCGARWRAPTAPRNRSVNSRRTSVRTGPCCTRWRVRSPASARRPGCCRCPQRLAPAERRRLEKLLIAETARVDRLLAGAKADAWRRDRGRGPRCADRPLLFAHGIRERIVAWHPTGHHVCAGATTSSRCSTCCWTTPPGTRRARSSRSLSSDAATRWTWPSRTRVRASPGDRGLGPRVGHARSRVVRPGHRPQRGPASGDRHGRPPADRVRRRRGHPRRDHPARRGGGPCRPSGEGAVLVVEDHALFAESPRHHPAPGGLRRTPPHPPPPGPGPARRWPSGCGLEWRCSTSTSASSATAPS